MHAPSLVGQLTHQSPPLTPYLQPLPHHTHTHTYLFVLRIILVFAYNTMLHFAGFKCTLQSYVQTITCRCIILKQQPHSSSLLRLLLLLLLLLHHTQALMWFRSPPRYFARCTRADAAQQLAALQEFITLLNALSGSVTDSGASWPPSFYRYQTESQPGGSCVCVTYLVCLKCISHICVCAFVC